MWTCASTISMACAPLPCLLGYVQAAIPADPCPTKEDAMAVKRPTPAQLRAVARDLGMTFADEDVASFLALMEGSIAAYDAVDGMPDYVPAVKYPRTPG